MLLIDTKRKKLSGIQLPTFSKPITNAELWATSSSSNCVMSIERGGGLKGDDQSVDLVVERG